MQTDTQNPNIKETPSLVASDMVVGTAVYDPQDEKIGSVERLILEKTSGRVSYAVLSFGGFLGIGEDYYPVPWQMLTYDESVGGFRVNISREQIENAPKYSASDDYDWSSDNGRRVSDYYGVPPFSATAM
ncbi:PRC-barrel domain-containing protein [Xanthobacter autotrophicus]|uniref:PRC-barrel domain-containing protein n=1 Tax=Xanthobacter autotrophicus TaxID=280 RepID=UPI0024A68D36|nr:PRC-barrel domain-containing protein [Xanthobacter autotrophicus]MDI4656171.1 PRC-barrel domain-containing protein [Xanthobacter autotrophicus]